MDKHINDRSRTATADHEEITDHSGNDTPRSGFATPEPDPQDKRLPGIMSYFGQVRPFQRLWSGTFSAAPDAAAQTPSTAAQTLQSDDAEEHHFLPPTQPSSSSPEPASRASSASASASEDQGPPLLPHEKVAAPSEVSPLPEGGGTLHPYPTPPASSRSSLRGANVGESSGEAARYGVTASAVLCNSRKMSVTDLAGLTGRRPSALAPVTSALFAESSVHAPHFSNPGSPRMSTSQSSPVYERPTSIEEHPVSEDRDAVHRLKELTFAPASKSGQSTPNRTLSSAQPAHNDTQDKRPVSAESSTATGTQTAVTPPTATSTPATKGKLTIKISEGRGLKSCRAPYVVAVFQRSELISRGPRDEDEDDESAISNVAMGGVPIQRQASDQGRHAMAIPMRSRQSSNTSTGEFNSFRNRTHRRSFTSPKWDAEAIL